MKKFIALALAILISGTLMVSCGGGGGASKTAAAYAGDFSDSDIKIGAIYINSKDDTAGYTFAHHNGISTALANLNIKKDGHLFIVDNVPEDKTQVLQAIDTLVGQGCTIIFGISFGYIDAMNEAAAMEEYQNIIFSHATGYMSNDKNFNNYFGRIYQARYLSGIAAGLKSLELGNNSVGYVAAFGTEYAETASGINGFALGVQSVNPDAVLHVKTINCWGDEALEKQAAEALISTYNCCVISQHCDSAQPQLVAQDKGVFGCGYNSDMSKQAPDAHLTAPIWNWDVYYGTAIRCAIEQPENFMSVVGNYYGGLKELFVDISPLSVNCSEGTKEITDAVKALIISGEWDVFSGVKLSYTKNDDGTYTVNKADADLKTNDGKVVVKAGGASVEDSVITGSMNYYVEGVED